MGIEQLLDKHRLLQHPFATWTAEIEPDQQLGECFVPPPFMDALLGNLGGRGSRWQVRSHLVFGRPGAGKTAIRLRMERQLLDERPNAMLLRYTDFVNPLSRGAKPPLGDHVDELLRLATAAILTRLHQSPSVVANLDSRQKGELLWLVRRNWDELPQEAKNAYASALNPLTPRVFSFAKNAGRAAIDAYNAVISILNKERIEPIDWEAEKLPTGGSGSPLLRMQRLWRLAATLGFDSLWVVVDKVDEAPGCQSADAIFSCLGSLLTAQTLLELSQGDEQVVCFKMFITKPDELQRLLDDAGFRKDRIKVDHIVWDPKELDLALAKRLAHFSNKHVLSFDSLCVADGRGTHDRLARECDGRPRTLFRMAHEIFEAFDRNSVAQDFKLDLASIEAGIAEGKAAVYD